MHSRTALLAALAAAGLAVALVAVDLAWNVTVSLQVMEDGSWTTVAEDDGDGYYGRDVHLPGLGCVSGPMRLLVDNDRPVGARLDVRVTAGDGGIQRDTLLDDSWRLGPFAMRSAEFDVPMLPPTDGDAYRFGDVYVEAGDVFLSVCREVAT